MDIATKVLLNDLQYIARIIVISMIVMLTIISLATLLRKQTHKDLSDDMGIMNYKSFGLSSTIIFIILIIFGLVLFFVNF